MIQHANVIIQKTIALSSQLNGSLSPRRLLDPSFFFTTLSDLIWRLWSPVETWLEIFSAKVHSFIKPSEISIQVLGFFLRKSYILNIPVCPLEDFLLKDAEFFIVTSSSCQNKIKRVFFFFDRLIKEYDEALIHPICTAKKDFQSLLITHMP